ncbi:MAG TPA: hypothetical protein VKB84_03510 [Candidatus Binataceae bacterium]|nr:hypothetical protein [Candidatus Binataceae bacterium]
MPNDDDKSNSDKPFFLTNDKNITEDEIDKMTQGESIKIPSAEFLMELAKAAKETYDVFEREIGLVMTLDRAVRIKELRKIYSWRALASATHEEWGDDASWSPPSNQLAGMALAKLAAQTLGEKEDDWYDRSRGN